MAGEPDGQGGEPRVHVQAAAEAEAQIAEVIKSHPEAFAPIEEQAAAAMNVVYRQLLQEDFNTIRTPSARLKERFTSKTLLLLLLDS